jgi:hypothetical protein
MSGFVKSGVPSRPAGFASPCVIASDSMRESVVVVTEPRPEKGRGEDVGFFVNGFAGVLDGASSPRERPPGCYHDSAWYARALAGNLLSENATRPDDTLIDLLRESIRRTAHDHVTRCRGPLRAASTVVLARHAKASKGMAGVERAASRAEGFPSELIEYLVLCDNALLVAAPDRDGNASRIQVVSDDRVAQLPLRTSREIRDLLASGKGYGPEYEALLREQAEELDSYRNVDGGYWVAAEDPNAADHAIVGAVPTSVQTICLVSDGVTRAVEPLRIYRDWDGLMRDLSLAGPEKVIAMIREVERADAEGHTHPRMTWSDDATAVVWRLGDSRGY